MPPACPKCRDGARLGVPLTGISKIVCVGLNYADHAAETGAHIPKEPILFLKAMSSLTGPNDDIVIPRGSVKTDWEVELGVVIGTRASYVNEQEALDHVAGYCVVNDVSEREYQIERGGQWDKGKGCDSFAPVGPWLVTSDEIADPQKLKLWTEVNGVRRQNGTHQDHDLRRAHSGQLYQPFHDPDAGRHHRHRHAAGRGHGHEAAAISQGRRRAAPVGRRPGRAEEQAGGLAALEHFLKMSRGATQNRSHFCWPSL